jgi:hypothetical protein
LRTLLAPQASGIRSVDHSMGSRRIQRPASAIGALQQVRPKRCGATAPELGWQPRRVRAVPAFSGLRPCLPVCSIGLREGCLDICQNCRRALCYLLAQLVRPNCFKTRIGLVRQLLSRPMARKAAACAGRIVAARKAISPLCSTMYLGAANSAITAFRNLPASIIAISPNQDRANIIGRLRSSPYAAYCAERRIGWRTGVQIFGMM